MKYLQKKRNWVVLVAVVLSLGLFVPAFASWSAEATSFRSSYNYGFIAGNQVSGSTNGGGDSNSGYATGITSAPTDGIQCKVTITAQFGGGAETSSTEWVTREATTSVYGRGRPSYANTTHRATGYGETISFNSDGTW